MTKAQIAFVSLLLYTSSTVHCFHHVKRRVTPRTSANAIDEVVTSFDPLDLGDVEDSSTRFRLGDDAPYDGRRAALIGLAASIPALASPEIASAATANAPNAIGSALVGYGKCGQFHMAAAGTSFTF